MTIHTLVFFDLETTGLPKSERNHVKITELCCIAVSRSDIIETKCGDVPANQKLSLLFDPGKEISAVATELTGLSRRYLKNCPLFADKIETILAFLNDLEEPICLVAHNGNSFDFKVLMTEFLNAGRRLPCNLLCVDSLVGFRKILKDNQINYRSFHSSFDDDIITDDDDEDFPALNISNEDWSEIDKLSMSLSDMAVKKDHSNCSTNSPLKLSTIYKRLLNKDITNAHRAEADCLMLLECVVTLKDQFLHWADASCKLMDIVKPFVPYNREEMLKYKKTKKVFESKN
ncbi:three-prime repair exonuclease 1-like [Plodia interpunctella]|uniref:three-prime repair exonuclease 1-like n=1 Tax=Plodia interpunctella TaxID=58824 RepID=UPI002368CD97|nr:three-prime repair exonuclease 1-like [Plodia interpunctella]XP_053620710.1 three-prime repair exonuclease 1-like [Plodia interpunctella]